MGAEESRFSRLCPACGRRVPQAVATCRCGRALSAGASAPPPAVPPDAAEPASDASSHLLTAAILLFVVGALGWGVYFRRPPAARPAAARAASPGPAGPDRAPLTRPASEWPDLSIDISRPAEPGRGAGTPSGVSGETTPPAASPPAPDSLEDVVDRVMPAVVMVESSFGTGSGFYVADATVITNAHVVGADASVTLRKADGTAVSARVARRVPSVDLAVLTAARASAGQVTIPLVMSGRLRVGQEVMAIGSALGALQNTVTRGIVSALRRSGAATLVQTDAAINPGNSGGPLLDRTGAAVGVTTMSYRQMQGLNFAVASDHVRAILDGAPDPAGPPPGAPAAGIQAMTPDDPSEADRLRAEGERAFERALVELQNVAAAFDDQWRQFRQSCYSGRVNRALSHEWLALAQPGGLPDPMDPGCASYHDDFTRRVMRFRDRSVQAENAARRTGVYPGTIRDERRRYRLDDALLVP